LDSSYGFDRPVFILAAPRSGSTLLFETLLQSRTLWSVGDETHGVFEKHPELRPGQGCDNNRLTESNCTPVLAEAIRNDFLNNLRNCEGVRYKADEHGIPRMLEKTPKNALRVPFLSKIFPDALFIYLNRDPKENMSSIMDAWKSGRFVMYPRKVGVNGPWSLVLPPGWWDVMNKPLADVAAFQWQSVHTYVLQDLAKLPTHRWTAVNYTEFLENTASVCERLCRFMDIEFDDRLTERAANPLPMSRYTMSNPTKNKWHRHGSEIARVLPTLLPTIVKINQATKDHCRPLSEDVTVDVEAMQLIQQKELEAYQVVEQNRNEVCRCGSGKKYKYCHGQL
jgi:hypothetical protein